MYRAKEITYILCLGILFYQTVQFCLMISPRPFETERIPTFNESRLELSAQPLTLMKELVTIELFQVKNQSFLTQLKQMIRSKNDMDQLDGIQIDFHKPMSLILMDGEKTPPFLLHFSASDVAKKKTIGKHYVQVGSDVFYTPSEPFTLKQINWLLKNVKWEPESIQDKQLVIQQNLNGKKTKGTLNWKENQLQFTSESVIGPRINILQPRYFHLSQAFPKNMLSAIPKDHDLRLLLHSLDRYSINYDGGKLTSDELFPFAASFEALLQYENPEAMKQAMNQFKTAFDTLKWEGNHVQMGTQHIYYQTIGPKTLYVCTDKGKFCPNGGPKLISCDVDFMCKGDLKRLTTVQNTGWAGLVLDMIPAFRASKELFDGTSKINTTKKGIDITFKPGKMVLHELINAMLVYGQE